MQAFKFDITFDAVVTVKANSLAQARRLAVTAFMDAAVQAPSSDLVSLDACVLAAVAGEIPEGLPDDYYRSYSKAAIGTG